jgi:hypothetical protein
MKKLQRLITVGFITGSLATALIVGSVGVSAGNHRANDEDVFENAPTATVQAAPIVVQGTSAPVNLIQQRPLTRDDIT